MDAIHGLSVDHGADAAGGIFGGGDFQAGDGFDQASEKHIVDIRQNDHARAGGTFLTRISKRAGDDACDGFIKVGIVIDDNGVFPAHLDDDRA